MHINTFLMSLVLFQIPVFGQLFLLSNLSRLKVTVFQVSAPVAAIRAATLNGSVAMATGTVLQAETRRLAQCAQTGSSLARAELGSATQP